MDTNRELLKQDMSCKLLVAFLEKNIEESEDVRQVKKKKAHQKEAPSAAGDQKVVDHGSLFEHRFPKSHWKEAVGFFSQ